METIDKINETLTAVANSPIVTEGTVNVEIEMKSIAIIALAFLAVGLIIIGVKKYL